MTKPIIIDYYSDILCVWAWIAERRIKELNDTLVGKVEFRYHYVDVFGDASNKIPNQWQQKGGFSGFSKHVIESAKPYPDAPINPGLWESVRPASSANPHQMLKAVELVFGTQVSTNMALLFRQAFFVDGKDISDLAVLSEIITDAGYALDDIKTALNNGSAIGALMADYQQAKLLSLKGSPTYIIDNGRQILFGNVGYRVLLANVEEQLKKSPDDVSWC